MSQNLRELLESVAESCQDGIDGLAGKEDGWIPNVEGFIAMIDGIDSALAIIERTPGLGDTV